MKNILLIALIATVTQANTLVNIMTLAHLTTATAVVVVANKQQENTKLITKIVDTQGTIIEVMTKHDKGIKALNGSK